MSNPRRSRYTVYYRINTDPQVLKKVILAFDIDSARRYFECRGVLVLGVEKGDHVNLPAAVRDYVTLKINQANLKSAVSFLGLAQPLDVVFSARRGSTYGNHRCRPVARHGWSHRIMLKSYLTPQQAGETLWHELAHALQFERDIISLGLNVSDSLTRWNRAYLDGTTYRQKPYEIEARSYEGFNQEIPLFG